MERKTLGLLALVWGVMLVTLVVMVIVNPSPAVQQGVAQSGGMPLGDMFGQVKQFMSDMQSNMAMPKELTK